MADLLKKLKDNRQTALAFLAGLGFALLVAALLFGFSTWHRYGVWAIALCAGALMFAAVGRRGYFVRMLCLLVVLLYIFGLNTMVLYKDEIPFAATGVQTAAVKWGAAEPLAAEMGLYDLMRGKTVITGPEKRFDYIIESFAAGMRVEAVSLPYSVTKGCDDIIHCASAVQIMKTRHTGVQHTIDGYDAAAVAYVWYDGLATADTLVLLDTEDYHMLLMSEAIYRQLKEGADD